MRTNLVVEIVRYVDDHQPGWVEAQFADATGLRHIIIDKVPVLAEGDIGPDSLFPQPSKIGCEILSQAKDDAGMVLVYITTARPDGVESTDGRSEFVVLPTQLSN
jgi:hypothetical protein